MKSQWAPASMTAAVPSGAGVVAAGGGVSFGIGAGAGAAVCVGAGVAVAVAAGGGGATAPAVVPMWHSHPANAMLAAIATTLIPPKPLFFMRRNLLYVAST